MKKYILTISLLLIAPCAYAADFNDGDSYATARAAVNSKLDESLYNAYTMVYADTDDIPAALSITANTIPGRLAAGIVALPVDASGDCAAGSACFGGHEHSGYLDTETDPTICLQEVTIADSADGSAATGNITPTVDCKIVNYLLTCSDADGCAVTWTEGSAAKGQVVNFMNISANPATSAYSAGVYQNSCGAGSTTTINQNETITVIYGNDLWRVSSDESSSGLCVGSISLQAGTINGAIKPVNQTSDTYTLGTNSTADSWGTYFTNTDAAADGAAYTMETAVAGMHFCVENGQGVTEVLSVTPAAGDYLVKNGVRGTAATARTSSGAAGDKICVFCQDATDCKITTEVGTWAE